MTGWILSFGWNWALVPVGVWVIRKLWIATRVPGLRYLQHTALTVRSCVPINEVHRSLLSEWNDHRQYPSLHPKEPELPGKGEDTALLDVERRGKMFPWGVSRETWLVGERKSVREGDGLTETGNLHSRFLGMIRVADARKAELEELSK